MQKMKQGDYSQSSFFSFFLKKVEMGKTKLSAAQFQYILVALNLAYNKDKLYKTLDYWSGDIPKFVFFF